MQHDATKRGQLHAVHSTASSGVPGVHIAASGTGSGEPLLITQSQSLRASSLSFERTLKTAGLSFERTLKTAGVVVALATTLTLSNDVALGAALVPVPLEIPAGAAAPPMNVAMLAASQARSLAALFAAIDEEPVEDGLVHRSEAAVAAHIREFGASGLVEHVCGASEGSRPASLLRLLSRVSRLDAEQRSTIVRRGLASTNVELRDAAVQAAETWEDAALAELLRHHREPVAWLSEYAKHVASDLES